MQQPVRDSISRLLVQVIAAIKRNDSFKLKELSNGNIHSATVFQDENSLSISVIIYALSKIIDHTTRKRIILLNLQRAMESLNGSNEERYKYFIRQLLESIQVEDSRLKKFVSSVIEQAQMKKGCALCEHGLSVGRVSNLLGISRWELMRYLGHTRQSEQSSENVPTEKRLELARSLFS